MRISNPQGNMSSLFRRRISNPPERLADSPHLAENTIFRKNYILKNTIFLENYIIDLKYNVELPHGLKGDSLIQHSTLK